MEILEVGVKEGEIKFSAPGKSLKGVPATRTSSYGGSEDGNEDDDEDDEDDDDFDDENDSSNEDNVEDDFCRRAASFLSFVCPSFSVFLSTSSFSSSAATPFPLFSVGVFPSPLGAFPVL